MYGKFPIWEDDDCGVSNRGEDGCGGVVASLGWWRWWHGVMASVRRGWTVVVVTKEGGANETSTKREGVVGLPRKLWATLMEVDAWMVAIIMEAWMVGNGGEENE